LILPITIAAPEEQTFLSDATGDATVINSGSVTDAKGAGKLAPPSRATVSTETRNRRHGLTALLLVGLAVLVAVGSSVGVFYFTRSNQHNPYPPYGTLALDDPLSDNSHGYNWLEGGDSFGTCAFTGKAYHVNAILDNATKGCFEDSSFRVAPSVLAVTVLSSALQTGRCVRLHYRSARSQVTERVFDPYGVVYHEGAWYTIGYCHLRQGQRLFRLDRILQVEVTGETFSRPADFQALEAIQHALASVPRVWQVEVWLETTLEEIQRKTRLSKAQFEEVQNGVLLRGDVEDLPWMARFLAGLGVPLIIHRPAELRTVLRQYALTLASYAEHIEA
jgi:hypothetical protein